MWVEGSSGSGGGGMSETLLWTNPSPNANYTTGTINVGASSYDMLFVICKSSKSSGSTASTYDVYIPKTSSNRYANNAYYAGYATTTYGMWQREFYISGDNVYIKHCYFAKNNEYMQTSDSSVIPWKIYGIKYS